jgi:hypothetical protein
MRDFETAVTTHLLIALEAWGGALRDGEPWARMFWAGNPAAQNREFGVDASAAAVCDDRELDAAERQALSRAIRKLAGTGVLVPIRPRGSRITHVRPTTEGLRIAIQLVRQDGYEPNLGDVLLALANTTWSTPEHVEAVRAMQEAQP